MKRDPSKYKRCIMILADGARSDLFEQLLAEGKLPNIQKYLTGPGSLLQGVTTFPSTTGPAYFPFLTGCFPGTLNVPGIRWFDKAAYASRAKKMVKFRSYVGIETFLINRDIKQVPTAFQLLKKSYTIFNSVTRGAGWGNITKLMRIWYWYYAHLTDRWEFVDQSALKKMLGVVKKDFDFLFTVLPGIDEYSHLAHPHHEKTIQAYEFLDKACGELISRLIADGRWEETLFWIVSDHGLSKTDTHFCVNTFLANRGLPPFYYPKVFHRAGKKVANMMSGNSMTHLYFKNGSDWGEPTSRAEIEKIDGKFFGDLLKEKAIDLIFARNQNGGIDILSKRGEASLTSKCQAPIGSVHYRIKTSCPFGYKNLAGDLSAETILKETIDSNYPDALWQIAALFKSSRTGDVVLSATPGFDLRLKHEIPEHKGSHGSIHKEHMLVPLVTNAKLEARYARTTDIFPTLLKLMGREIPSGIDGELLG